MPDNPRRHPLPREVSGPDRPAPTSDPTPRGLYLARRRDHELIRTVPHVAFEVDDLDAALEGQQVIHPPGEPSEGVRSAMIVHDGAPIELLSFRKEGQ